MNKILKSLVLLTMATGLAGQAAAEPHRISAEDIATSLMIDSQSARIHVPAVVSRAERPTLQLFAHEQRGSLARLRVRCASRECLPFYVELQFASADAASQFCAGLVDSVARRKWLRPALVHSGSIVKLEIHARGVRLQLYVRCLQGGAQGDVIRARDDVSKRIYMARVVDKDHLRFDL